MNDQGYMCKSDDKNAILEYNHLPQTFSLLSYEVVFLGWRHWPL